MGYDYDELFPGRFLKSGQFKGRDVTLTVAGIRIEKLPQEGGKDRARGCIAFRETELELVLNRTNGEALKAMFGRETDNWIGKRVTFYPAPYTQPGEDEPGTCIRVRGSPDIDRDITFELKLPRKRATKTTLRRTVKANGKAKQETPPEELAAPDHNPETGEVLES